MALRKWQPLAPLGTPNIWWQLSNMWTTRCGAYYPQNLFASVYTPSLGSSGDYVTRAWCALLTNDSVVGYVGTLTKIYQYDGASTFTDRSPVGNYPSSARPWNFAQFGDISLASNRSDKIQFRDATTANLFADIPDAPLASIIVTQSGAVLAFDINDGTERRSSFAACAPGDYLDWTGPSATTATSINHRPGRITAAVAFKDYVLVFKKSSVYKVWYTGNIQYKWKIEVIATGRGAWGCFDVVNCGDCVVFSGPGGVWKFDGTNWTELTKFFGEVPQANSSLYQPLSQNVLFFTGDLFATGEQVTTYCYNLVSDTWGSGPFLRAGGTTPSDLQDMWGARAMTGEPAALLAMVAPTAALPDLVMTIPHDLSTGASNGIVRKSSTYWGGGPNARKAYISTGVEGINGNGVALGDRNSRWGRVVPVYTCSIARTSDISPGSGELRLALYGGNAIDAFSLVSTSGDYLERVSSETEQRRFQLQKGAPFGKLLFEFPGDSGYTELLDFAAKLTDAGTFNPALS